MIVAWIVAALFAAGALYNVYRLDLANAVVGGTIASLLVFLARHSKAQEIATHDFLAWLEENRAAIEGGGSAVYRALEVRADTELREFHLAMSFLLVTLFVPSRLIIAGEGGATAVRLLYTAASLIFGWWAIPWGPVRTAQAVGRNLAGGKKTRVADLLAKTQS